MSFSTDNVFSSYLGNGVDDRFSITFAFMPGEYAAIKSALYNLTDPLAPIRLADPVLDGGGIYDYTLEIATPVVGSPEETAIAVVNTPIPTNHRLYYFRSSGASSPVNYNDLRFPYKTVQSDFDRLYQMAQENRRALDNAKIIESFIPIDQVGSPFYGTVEAMVEEITGTTVVPVFVGAGVFAASDNGKYIMNSLSSTTIQLPFPHVAGKTVTIIEASGDASNKVVDGNGSTIIGVGATYTLQSEYESKTLLSDGADWYFI